MEKALRDKVIRVYPARVSMVCAQSLLSDSKHLARTLVHNYKENIISSKLIESKKYYLSLTVKTSSVQRMLCDICENSERVYIGHDYEALFCEHGRVLIAKEAIEALSQK